MRIRASNHGDSDEHRASGVATPDTPGPHRVGDRNAARRGQTTLDFALGISLFLIVLVVVFQFIPGLLQPFNSGTQGETVAVDRIADQLAGSLLAESSSPYVLLTDCTREFFDDYSPGACPHSGSTLNERIGVQDYRNVRVLIEGNVTGTDETNTLCWKSTTEEVVEEQDTGCDVKFAAGPTQSSNSASTASARRVVWIDGHDATLVVEVW